MNNDSNILEILLKNKEEYNAIIKILKIINTGL
jgi:hypothetical protein